MFENVPSFQGAFGAGTVRSVATDSTVAKSGKVRAGDALRAMGWGELAARINAARDLRAVMRRDAASGSMNVASFGDAAASYFAAITEGERPVNSIALEGRKASDVEIGTNNNDAAIGDRENKND
ncbi:MAG: hypothetical protein AAGL68_05665 [Pseudomonadota bacterium]